MGQSLKVADTGSLLRNPALRRLLVAQFLSIADVYGLTLAGAVLVEEQTQSSGQAGLALLSAILPAFLGSLFAGAVVDRWGRVQVLTASYLGRALAALAFWAGALYLDSSLAPLVIYAVIASSAVFSQFAIASELSLLPDLVDRSRLLSANSLVQFNILLAEAFGIAVLTPFIVKWVGVPAVGFVGALFCLIAAALVVNLQRGQVELGEPGEAADSSSLGATFGRDLQAGWRYIAQDRLLRLVVAQATLAAALLLVLASLLPALAARHLGLGVEDVAVLLLPAALGFVLGSVLMNRLEGRLSRTGWIAVGLIGLGIGLVLLGFAIGEQAAGLQQNAQFTTLWFVLPLILGLGFMLALILVPARTVLQERPPAEMRGRVISAQLALGNAVAVVPLVLGGSLADAFGIQPVMGMLGVVAVAAGAVGLHQMHRV